MTGWSPAALAVAYDERLLDWRLGDGHPTDPVRARLAVKSLAARGVAMTVKPITCQLTDELLEVHTAGHLARCSCSVRGTAPAPVRAGESSHFEWFCPLLRRSALNFARVPARPIPSTLTQEHA